MASNIREIREIPEETNDLVNHPAHYNNGKTEVIDIIEDAIKDAPESNLAYLQGSAIKYLMRMWLKNYPKQDAQKAMWYLGRLIEKL
jgi:hypothetical protein